MNEKTYGWQKHTIRQITTEDLIVSIVRAGYSWAGTDVEDFRAEYDRRMGQKGAWETAPGMVTKWGRCVRPERNPCLMGDAVTVKR